MNKRIASILIALIVASCPINALKATENLSDSTLKQEEMNNTFYIKSDTKKVVLKIDKSDAFINDKRYILNNPPTIIDSRIYMPFKFVVEEVLDGTGSWDAKNKRITLNKYNKNIILYEGKKTAIINGNKISMEAAPVIQKNSLLIPLKFLGEQFDMPFLLDKEKSTINLTLTDDLTRAVQGNRPIAKFSFEKQEYIAGTEIKVIDESFDNDGDVIIEKEWQVDGDTENRVLTLEPFLKKPEVGFHNISLRVKDDKRNWSQWYTQRISILPNNLPIVSDIKLSKDSFAQGEKIELGYTFENEEWEPIAEEVWSYRYIDEKNSIKESTIGKPTALFYPGKFIVELQIKDAYGNISEKKQVHLTITDKVIQSELDYKFNENRIGSLIDNFQNFNYQNYSLVDGYTVIDTGAKLIMSNSPESVKQKGILYKDVIKGPGRILYHHRNMIDDATDNKRFVIIMENKNDFPITVTKRREGTKGPTLDILYAGSEVLKDFMQKDFYQEYMLNKGEKKYLFDTGGKQWIKGDTVSGMIEFYSNEEVHITIAMVGENTKFSDIENLSILKRDGIHSRGTFENADRYYDITLNNDKPYRIMLGKPAGDTEKWMEGYDALTGEPTIDKGNYGMVYWLRINVKEDTGILFNARGNIYKGAIGWADAGSYRMPEASLLKNIQQGVVTGIAKKDKRNELMYVLPNGSAAPNYFCFIPKSQWNK